MTELSHLLRGQSFERKMSDASFSGRIEAGRPLPLHLRGAVIALGNFDGFHLGHQAVVGRAVAMARERGVAAIVGTFDPHPVDYFKPGAAPFRLTTLDQRQRLFASAGVDVMMVFRFNSALASSTPEEFVGNWLADMSGVVTGEDFTFGRGRIGNVSVLAELCATRRMSAVTVKPVMLDGAVVSSTRIRNALQDGDFAMAERLLFRPLFPEKAFFIPEKHGAAISLLIQKVSQG